MHNRCRNAGFAILAALGTVASPVAATALSDLVDSLQPGEFAELQSSGYTRELLEVGSHTILEYAAKGLWNPIDRRLDFIGEGHTGGRKHIRYDEATNTWSELPEPPYFVGHSYDQQTIDPATGVIYARAHNSASFRRYSEADGWERLPTPPFDNWQVAGGLEWFPELGGFVFVDSVSGVWLYDVAAEEWELIDEPDPIGPLHNFAAYNPVHEVMLLGGGNNSTAVYLLDSDRRLKRVADSPNGNMLGPSPSQGRIVADVVTGDYLAFFVSGEFWRYDVRSDRWQFIDSHPLVDQSREWFNATAIDTHGVVLFMLWDGSASSVYVYRHTDQLAPPPDPDDGGTNTDGGGNDDGGDGEGTSSGNALGWPLLAAIVAACGLRRRRGRAQR